MVTVWADLPGSAQIDRVDQKSMRAFRVNVRAPPAEVIPPEVDEESDVQCSGCSTMANSTG